MQISVDFFFFFFCQGVTDNISSNPESWMISNKHPHLEDSLQSVLLLLGFCFIYFVIDTLGMSKGPIGDLAGRGPGQSECSVTHDLKDANSSGPFQHVMFLQQV